MSQIKLINPFNQEPLIKTETGLQDSSGNFFPYREGVYDITLGENYTGSFGYQWNRFRTTQIDKFTFNELSKERFFAETSWKPESLDGKNILEVGSGAGRFTQIVLDHTNANIYSVDYSDAVEANYRNNGPNERLKLFKASIYDLPFEAKQFDKVFCFGVLQHTPDVEKSVAKLIAMLKPGGELVVDFYPISGWWTMLHAKYLFRPFTKKMSHDALLQKIDRNADKLIRTYRFFSRLGVGKLVNRFLPVCDIDGTLPDNLSPQQLRDMVVLDTFDMFSPEYDQPQRVSTVTSWFHKNGMENVWGGFIRYNKYRAAVVKGTAKIKT